MAQSQPPWDYGRPSHTRRSSSTSRRPLNAPTTTASPSPSTQQPYFSQDPSASYAQESFLAPQPATSPPASRKRKAPGSSVTAGTSFVSAPGSGDPADLDDPGQSQQSPIIAPAPKKSRTNTPWSPAEEQRLKMMRDAGNSWGEIAKVRTSSIAGDGLTDPSFLQTFPTRTEGSVKKHWYKVRLPINGDRALNSRAQTLIQKQDMHYADFAEDEVNTTTDITLEFTNRIIERSSTTGNQRV